MLTRRQLIKRGAAAGAGVMFGGALLEGSAWAATSVAAGLTPFVDSMPVLVDNAIDLSGGGSADITAGLIARKVHRDLPATILFGYLQPNGPAADAVNASYLGPAIVAKSGVSASVNYTNRLAANDYLKVSATEGAATRSSLIPTTRGQRWGFKR